jgi:hypothetical protein
VAIGQERQHEGKRRAGQRLADRRLPEDGADVRPEGCLGREVLVASANGLTGHKASCQKRRLTMHSRQENWISLPSLRVAQKKRRQ